MRICYALLVSSLLGLVLVGCRKTQEDLQSLILISPTGEHIELRVEMADEPGERSKGLMFRTSLKEGRGMLFLFEKEEILSFWMKNTKVPLDILFFDRSGSLVSSASMEPCLSDPCPTYPSKGPAQFALEVPLGFREKHQVKNDWKVVLKEM